MTASPTIAFKTLGGRGPHCLLLHGFGSERLSWLGIAPVLQTRMTVHALDLPGHGESSSVSSEVGPRTLAGIIAADLKHRGLEGLHVVGHSLGGAVGLVLADEYRELIASLALIAPAGLGQGIDPKFLKDYAELATPEAATTLLCQLVVKPHLIGKQVVQRALAQLDRPGAREGLKAIARGLVREEPALLEVALRVAKRPMRRLVLWGTEDRINPPDSDKLAHFSGTSHMIEGAGHLPHIENPKAVSDLLLGFMET
jgi:pyruvate dehydrogenase E2 component (dihydrolipoamide acetyltransferase)